MKKIVLIISALILIELNINAIQQLTPIQQQEYDNIQLQLSEHLDSIPKHKRKDNDVELYLKKIGTPIALLLLDNIKKMSKLCNEGDVFFEMENYKCAANKLTEALSIDGTGPAVIWAMRGRCYEKLGSYELALSDYNKAISIENNFASYYMLRATCYAMLNKLDAAMEDIKKAALLGDSMAVQAISSVYNDTISAIGKGIADSILKASKGKLPTATLKIT